MEKRERQRDSQGQQGIQRRRGQTKRGEEDKEQARESGEQRDYSQPIDLSINCLLITPSYSEHTYSL